MKTINKKYEKYAEDKAVRKNYKLLATAILASAIEDADVKFLEDDYAEWKKMRLSSKKHYEVLTELDLKKEFKLKEDYKEMLFNLGEIIINKKDIPSERIKERNLYECNLPKNLMQITGYKLNTLTNIAKSHGWKIGSNYKEPTIFDL
jgi:hypothetical protein